MRHCCRLPIACLEHAALALTGRYADAAGDEEGRGRIADALHPEGFARCGQGGQLAARAQRPDLPGHASLLAEDGAALDPPGRRRHVAAAGDREGQVTS